MEIHRGPTLDLIVHVYKQLKCNTQYVPTMLGRGRALAYLALVITAITYGTIPSTITFVCPSNPGSFTITPNPMQPLTGATPDPVPTHFTAADNSVQKHDWEEHECIFNKVQADQHYVRSSLGQ